MIKANQKYIRNNNKMSFGTIKELGLFLVLAIAGVSASSVEVASAAQTTKLSASTNQKAIGGWYPVFFNKYDESAVQSIVKNIQAGRVAKVTITYDENYSLAKKVLTKIQAQVNLKVGFEQVKLEDGSAKFNHKIVVVTVYNLAK